MKRVVKYKSIDPFYSDVTQTYIGMDADEIDRIQEETEASMGNCHHAGIRCIYEVEVLLDETDTLLKGGQEMSNKFNKSLMYTLLLTVTILCSVNVIMSCNRINKRHHHMSNHIVTWPASTTKCFYFIDWHNGLVGIFDSEDFSQCANCPVDSFYKTVHGFGSYQEIVLIELKNNQELNKLKVENGYPPDDTY